MLGGFRISVGTDKTIEAGAWRLRKAASLVKLLALAPGHRLHREQAIDLLWPEMGRKATANNLRQALHVARKTLDPDQNITGSYLSSVEESLILCPEGNLWVDAEAFEVAASMARRSRDPAAYGAAIELYAGELLPADRYEGWAEGRRQELRQLYLALLVELAGLHGERGENEGGISVLRRVLREEPAMEEAHASLMRLYALSGRRREAILQYDNLRRALSDEVGAEPSAESRRLYEEIMAGGGGGPLSPSRVGPEEELANTSGRHNLPSPLSSFVGREREMVEARRLLAMGRLLTLTGAGGSGKTRLALEVARGLAGTYQDGVWLVELAPLSEPDLVPQAVATAVAKAVAVRERPGTPLLETLIDDLGDKEMLLVLDNCEHLRGSAARTGEALLRACPRLKVLATSREPLGIRGEVLWQVSPLSVPDVTQGGGPDGRRSVEGLMRSEAIRLFVDRARLRVPDFELTRENAGAVARVCRKLDGIPLAIELATARMGPLAVQQVAQRLDASLDVLREPSPGAEARQQTLRATLDWSHDLLSGAEQGLLRRLSVFSGGWTLEAAEAVCPGGGIDQEDVLDLIGGVVAKSLVLSRASTGVAARYGMLEPIRRYSTEKLEESGEAREMRGRHAAFFLALAEEAEPGLVGPGQGALLERLEGEHDNLREALSWALAGGEDELALRLGAALWRFWYVRGHIGEGVGWLERVLASSEPAARVKALEGMGWLLQYRGDSERAQGTYEQLMGLSRELGDKGSMATALNSLGTVAAYRGDNGRARALLEENLSVLRQMEGEDAATALKRFHALNLLGLLAINEEGDYARGAALWEESLELAREVGDTHRVVSTLSNLGYVAVLLGNHGRARELCEEAVALAHELGSAGAGIVPAALVNLGLAALGSDEHARARSSFDRALATSQSAGAKPLVIDALEGMASLAGAMQEDTRAARLWGAASAAREATGIALPPGERALHEPYLTSARSRLGEEEWEEASAEGRVLSLEEAADYALAKAESDGATTPAPEHPPLGGPKDELTRRETEIASLVAQGLTNRQIARELSISERTAANHVAKILKKLGLASRTQIGELAIEGLPHRSLLD
jgi:predicted ATPase/DNA-binding SARP family transcriptional activator/DNA-binding CsgD family transcriptional regulator